MASEKLKGLGDPSGKQDAAYWDEWFKIVCCENHNEFEWYCSAEEVIRVLRYHFDDGEGFEELPLRMLHPGSGTSLLPLKLREFPHNHVVVDISDVAMKEMRDFHEKQYGPIGSNSIQYVTADILKPPLPLEESSFDVWLDKGFADAVFSGNQPDFLEQSAMLFNEAHRLLRDSTGLVLVVSLCEDHSLEIAMNAWLQDEKWEACMHVHELIPISGKMRPFALVFSKKNGAHSGHRIMWHGIDSEEEEIDFSSVDKDNILEAVRKRISERRLVAKKKRSQRRLFATLEVKPTEPAADLQALASLIISSTWYFGEQDGDRTQILPEWKPVNESSTSLVATVPIGFGISKIRLRCVVVAEHVEILAQQIEDMSGVDSLGGIQSVDVDWGNTFEVFNAGDVIG